jgi:hypothetical protein
MTGKGQITPSKELFAGLPASDTFNLENPRAVINLVPATLRDALLDPELPKHWLDLPEKDLLDRCEPHLEPRDYRLRLTFWDEYNQAQDENRIMKMERIYVGACSGTYFYSRVLKDHHKLIFMLAAPAHYAVTMKELLQLALSEMRKVMAEPNRDGNGKLNIPLIKEKVKIFNIVDNRVQGNPEQKWNISQKTLNVNMSADQAAKMQGQLPAERNVSAIDQEIEALEREMLPEKSEIIKSMEAENIEAKVLAQQDD